MQKFLKNILARFPRVYIYKPLNLGDIFINFFLRDRFLITN